MLDYELPNIRTSTSAKPGASSYRASPWNGYHRRHLVLLANRHKLHKYNLPQTIIDENGKVALKHANGHLTRYTDQMANAFNFWLLIWLQYLAYCWKRLSSGSAKMQHQFNKSLLLETATINDENPVHRNGKNGKNGVHENNNCHFYNNNNDSINKLNKHFNGGGVKPKTKQRLLNHNRSYHQNKNGYYMKKRAEIELNETFEKLKIAEQAAFSLIPFARCRFDLDDIDYEHEPENLLEKACETNYITAVFEAKNRGIQEIAAGIWREMSEWYDQGLVIVCCELVWSVPFKHRDIKAEIRLKDDVLRALRYNNRRVLDEVDKKNVINEKDKKMVIFPESMIEEVAGRKDGCYMGSYRRYYDGLLPYSHNDTKTEHEPYWALDKKKLPEEINWPIIASQSKTAFLMLNLICLRFDELY